MPTLSCQILRQSIENEDLSGVVNILAGGNVNIDECDECGWTCLMHASKKHNVGIVKELLSIGADVNAVDNNNCTALFNASTEGHIDVVCELLDFQANKAHRDLAGWTALMWACYRGRTEVVKELLAREASPNIKAEHNMTCLIWAAGRGYTEIVQLLLAKSAKVNSIDKYGTTALIWACRKGHHNIVEELLNHGAHVDIAGMNSWTALLVATKGGFTDIVQLILDHSPNVNAVDKDGYTALTIAAKDGCGQIVKDLLNKGAYVNLTDRYGDTILTQAAKGGHIEVVRLLLKKHADINGQGPDNKTALYYAVDKSFVDVTKAILEYNPNLELQTKDGTTPLLRAVKNKNEELVSILLAKGAKVSTPNKKGDNALHAALRVRNRRIIEMLLRNPRESRLLYRPNKNGETPYMIDCNHQKSLLTSIFGARHLNQPETGENFPGYEIYSSCLSDILSEPTLNTPMTVGLFAKWGSGKSFLLEKLQGEMKTFAYQAPEPTFSFTWLVFFLLLVTSGILGTLLSLILNWKIGLGVGLGIFLLSYILLGILWFSCNKRKWYWAYYVSTYLGRGLCTTSLLLKLLFCSLPKKDNDIQPAGINFLFANYTKLSSGGVEKSLASMTASLCKSVEQEYGLLITRLYKVFKPQAGGLTQFKCLCCIPYFVIVLFVIGCMFTCIGLLSIYGIRYSEAADGIMVATACVLGLALLGNIYTWWQVVVSLAFSQSKRITKVVDKVDDIKMESIIQTIKAEVMILSKLVTCMDRFSESRSRLVIVVDGLDSCEQDKVLQVLDTVHNLFSDQDSPFITILAVDPHIIIKGIEHHLHLVFHESSINGHDYLRNIVDLPFYLQSQGLPRPVYNLKDERLYRRADSTSRKSKTSRHLSVVSQSSSLHNSNMMSSSMLALQSSQLDLSRNVVKNDYFSDINPRSMKRLVNIVAITGRLLRAYNVDYSWYRLSAWVNITEQWAYRVSWIISYFEQAEKEEPLPDKTSLKVIYDKISVQLPSKEVEPLMEIDRNSHKLEVILTSHNPPLNVGDLRKFLPCTISIDPYLRKLIKDFQQHALEESIAETYPSPYNTMLPPPIMQTSADRLNTNPAAFVQQQMRRRHGSGGTPPIKYGGPQMVPYGAYMPPFGPYMWPSPMMPQGVGGIMPPGMGQVGVSPATQPSLNIQVEEKLVLLSAVDVGNLLTKLEGLDQQMLGEYKERLLRNNISGQVLMLCDLDELKGALQMTFGDWQLFKSLVVMLREKENRTSVGSSPTYAAGGEGHCPGFTEEPRIRSSSVHMPVAKYPNLLSRQDATDGCPDIIVTQPSPGSSRPASPSLPGFKTYSQSQTSKETTVSASNAGMKRNDSLLQQILQENQMLKQVMDSFTKDDIIEDDEDEECLSMNATAPDWPDETNSQRSVRFSVTDSEIHTGESYKQKKHTVRLSKHHEGTRTPHVSIESDHSSDSDTGGALIKKTADNHSSIMTASMEVLHKIKDKITGSRKDYTTCPSDLSGDIVEMSSNTNNLETLQSIKIDKNTYRTKESD